MSQEDEISEVMLEITEIIRVFLENKEKILREKFSRESKCKKIDPSDPQSVKQYYKKYYEKNRDKINSRAKEHYKESKK